MKKFILFSLLLIGSTVKTQEIYTLTTPITKPSQLSIKIERVTIDVVTKTITIQWLGNNDEAGTAVYSTPPPASNPTQPSGATLLTTLNKLNFSGVNPSFVARIINRLTLDSYIPPGTVSGTPE